MLTADKLPLAKEKKVSELRRSARRAIAAYEPLDKTGIIWYYINS